MAYEGNVTLINGLIQANGQNFPLVHMDAVYVDDDMRLSDALRELAGAATPFALTSISTTPEVAETGDTVTEIIFTYEFNQIPETLRIAGVEVEEPARSGQFTLTGQNITAETSFLIYAVDEGSSIKPRGIVNERVSLYFKHRIYWGVAEEPTSLTEEFVEGLSESELSDTLARTITLTAGEGEYLWFAYPENLGFPTFEVNGFLGGFIHAGVVAFPARNVSYRVYRSGKPAIGTVTAHIS